MTRIWLVALIATVGACAALEKSMRQGDWTFRAARVPKSPQGQRCTASCQAGVDGCYARLEAIGEDHNTASVGECHEMAFSCYLACPGASDAIASGHGQPEPFEQKACTDGLAEPAYCMTITGVHAHFLD
jgi:hypothetical protein